MSHYEVCDEIYSSVISQSIYYSELLALRRRVVGGAKMSGTSCPIGLSVASVLPQSLIPKYGLWYAEYVAREAGYDGLQLLPLWMLSRYDLELLKRSGFLVLTCEGSWNNMYFDDRTTLGRILRLDWGILLDTALFGTAQRVQKILKDFSELFPEAVSIDIDPRGVREISPHHRMSRNQWIGYKGGVVFDTHHIYEFPFIKDNKDAAEFVEELFEEKVVRVVHIQFRDKEKLEDFLTGSLRSLELFVLSQMNLRNISLPIIVEIHPKLLPLGRKGRIESLKCILQRIRFHLKP